MNIPVRKKSPAAWEVKSKGLFVVNHVQPINKKDHPEAIMQMDSKVCLNLEGMRNLLETRVSLAFLSFHLGNS